VFSRLRPDGYILINSARSFSELGLGELAERFRRVRC
jgi:pyruvate ferredoxin oxidoreductase gamma subunit